MYYYQFNKKGVFNSLKFISLAFIMLVIMGMMMSINLDATKYLILWVFLILIFAALCGPSLYLIYQYRKATTYSDIEIDTITQKIKISQDGLIKERSFEEIKRIELVEATKHPIFLHRILMFSAHFYYYKLEFQDECYYLTSLLSPQPQLRGEKDFYDWFFKTETYFASISSTK